MRVIAVLNFVNKYPEQPHNYNWSRHTNYFFRFSFSLFGNANHERIQVRITQTLKYKYINK